MAPRSTALAGAQLAARQLNCESVFRGVLSYGRGRNNAPSASVAPRGSAQPGCESDIVDRVVNGPADFVVPVRAITHGRGPRLWGAHGEQPRSAAFAPVAQAPHLEKLFGT